MGVVQDFGGTDYGLSDRTPAIHPPFNAALLVCASRRIGQSGLSIDDLAGVQATDERLDGKDAGSIQLEFRVAAIDDETPGFD